LCGETVLLLLLQFVFHLGASLRNLVDQLSHCSGSRQGVLLVLVVPLRRFILWSSAAAVGMVVELVEESQEGMSVVGSGLPAVAIRVMVAAAAVRRSSSS
jgi:hypothetical protein